MNVVKFYERVYTVVNVSNFYNTYIRFAKRHGYLDAVYDIRLEREDRAIKSRFYNRIIAALKDSGYMVRVLVKDKHDLYATETDVCIVETINTDISKRVRFILEYNDLI